MVDTALPIMKKSQRVKTQRRANPRPVGEKTDIKSLVKAGVDGFILKGASFDQFLKAIRTAVEYEDAISPPVVSRIVKQAVRKRKQELSKPNRQQ